MTDLVFLALAIAASAVAIVWTIFRARNSYQQILWREIRRDLERHQAVVLKRYPASPRPHLQ